LGVPGAGGVSLRFAVESCALSEPAMNASRRSDRNGFVIGNLESGIGNPST
jgi:hypothetical protein